ncbi:MAG TPA: hypothetical protein VGN64_03130 [Dyadobacter sp.]|jgi:hypothetical protein|nr:hypothetical protein [Dyadobacter sp.]
MNQTFDIHRFALLLRLNFAEKGKSYLLMGALLIVVLLAMVLPLALYNGFSDLLLILHFLALFMVVMFGGSLYTSVAFGQYGPPNTGIAAIMVPASQFEKFLVSLLVNLLFTVPVAIFYVKFHYWSVDFANSKLPAKAHKYNTLPVDIMKYFIYLHIVIQGATILGSIYFRKLAYIKTAGIFLIIMILFTIINLTLIYQYTSDPSRVVAFPFGSWQIYYYEMNQYYNLDYSEATKNLIYAFPIFFLLSTWFISYVRLKEKQI